MPAESKIISAVKSRLDWYKRLGLVPFFRRIQCGRICINGRWIDFGEGGASDFIFIIHDKEKKLCSFVFAECKNETGQQSKTRTVVNERTGRIREIKGQEEFEQEVKYLPNVYYKIIRHPNEIDALIELLTGHYQKQMDAMPEDL